MISKTFRESWGTFFTSTSSFTGSGPNCVLLAGTKSISTRSLRALYLSGGKSEYHCSWSPMPFTIFVSAKTSLRYTSLMVSRWPACRVEEEVHEGVLTEGLARRSRGRRRCPCRGPRPLCWRGLGTTRQPVRTGRGGGPLKGMGLAMPGFDQNEIPPRNATPEEVKARIRDAKKCWDRLRAVMTMVEKKEGFSIPWFSRNVYAGAFWGSLAYSWGTAVDGFYASLVEGTALPLPLQWRFQIDPKQEGEKAGWFRSDMDDSQWGTIRTDACWEEQGFGQVRFPENGSDGYNGKAWYRVHTTIPESRKGQRIWLELGAVDESFTAWVNGKQCATFDYDKQPDKDAWQEPHLIDITNAVRYGQDNLIAVEVVDLKGSGGIWKPCFIKFDQKKTK